MPDSSCVCGCCSFFGWVLQTEMPIGYYSMPFCKPAEGVHRSTSTINPGTILLGVRIENSPYNFTIMVGAGRSGGGPAGSATAHDHVGLHAAGTPRRRLGRRGCVGGCMPPKARR